MMDSSKSVWMTLGVSENPKSEHSLIREEKHFEYVSSDLPGNKQVGCNFHSYNHGSYIIAEKTLDNIWKYHP